MRTSQIPIAIPRILAFSPKGASKMPPSGEKARETMMQLSALGSAKMNQWLAAAIYSVPSLSHKLSIRIHDLQCLQHCSTAPPEAILTPCQGTQHISCSSSTGHERHPGVH